MSSNQYVIGYVPPDARFKKMKQIWYDCKEMDIEPPDEVYEFFDGTDPSEAGMHVELKYKEWSNGEMNGLEIKTDDIPINVKTIQFVNSY